ncbi:MAG: hypothetical protein M0Z48_10375 [Nitrospiraceae bacterium]|nr:hypothetical protein [Nitrospiraceae bacterium]
MSERKGFERFFLFAVVVVVMFCSCTYVANTLVYADDDTYTQIQELVNDLGPAPYRSRNNGRVQRCADGGTKQITIRHTKYGTMYKGVYHQCREYGQFRDGNVEITTGN